jgi:hypothetical protein
VWLVQKVLKKAHLSTMLRVTSLFQIATRQLVLSRYYATTQKAGVTALRAKLDLKTKDGEAKKKLLQKQREREDKRRTQEVEREKARKESAKVREHKDRLRKLKQAAEEKEKRRKERARAVLRRQKEKMASALKLKKEAAKNAPKKRRVDPDRPKRPLNARLWYQTQNYSRIVSSLTGSDNKYPSVGDVARAVTNEFANLSQGDRDYYAKLAADDLERYNKAMKVYRQKKDQNKKPLTPYIRFFVDIRPTVVSENPSASITDVAKLIAVRWNQLGEAEKQKYFDAYEEERQQRAAKDQ